MIEGNRHTGYTLTCDYCGYDEPTDFNEFYEAVDFKKVGNWRSVHSADGQWHDLCPECDKPVIVAKLKSLKTKPEPEPDYKKEAAKLAKLAAQL